MTSKGNIKSGLNTASPQANKSRAPSWYHDQNLPLSRTKQTKHSLLYVLSHSYLHSFFPFEICSCLKTGINIASVIIARY